MSQMHVSLVGGLLTAGVRAVLAASALSAGCSAQFPVQPSHEVNAVAASVPPADTAAESEAVLQQVAVAEHAWVPLNRVAAERAPQESWQILAGVYERTDRADVRGFCLARIGSIGNLDPDAVRYLLSRLPTDTAERAAIVSALSPLHSRWSLIELGFLEDLRTHEAHDEAQVYMLRAMKGWRLYPEFEPALTDIIRNESGGWSEDHRIAACELLVQYLEQPQRSEGQIPE